MPKRNDLKNILIIGSGPIVIGQGCEFDYSGTQACRALRKEGYKVILVNSNPATIMTDLDIADKTYIEPVTWEIIADIIAKEAIDAVLPTMGGQTALNCALDLEREGILKKLNVELIGANKSAIDAAEDREKFHARMKKIGLDVPQSRIAHSLEEAISVQPQLGFPTIIRPSYTLGGAGGGVAHNIEEFEEICRNGLLLSPTSELLIEESLLGWKEYELEVVRDKNDNSIVVCSIENIDPMGVHTGDSITVAPQQTLTDIEYQKMRTAAIKVLREIGVETGGSNVQFAVNPATGRQVVIEMNPRVSRSSALASKATGFPIAKIAALLAVGFTLDELKNDMTRGMTPAAFEPSIDYVVVKIPRFNFDKFKGASDNLTTQMKSVGEVMAIGQNFRQALQKAFCSTEQGIIGFASLDATTAEIKALLSNYSSKSLFYIAELLRRDVSIAELNQISGVDVWFISQIKYIIAVESKVLVKELADLTLDDFKLLKQNGFSDDFIAARYKEAVSVIYNIRKKLGVTPVFKHIDSCAAEFATNISYLYSTYEQFCENTISNRNKVIVIGSGPNRIGQGVEFDYCCVQAIMGLKANSIEAIMINCNPETVSTDYDIADKLYFEPITFESVMGIIDIEKPLGVIVQFGGQTPLKLAHSLKKAGVKILGTQPENIDKAENRDSFLKVIDKLNLNIPASATATLVEEGVIKAQKIGYPVMVRPSYVLGGQSMELVHTEAELVEYLSKAFRVNENQSSYVRNAPVLIDKYLGGAIEVDVDAICSPEGKVVIAGILEHIEQAGVHSGDSACAIPPFRLSQKMQAKIEHIMCELVKECNVIGVANAQFAIKDDTIYVIEMNPRASRTVPFVAKAVNIPIVKLAINCILGQELEINVIPNYQKLSFSFVKLPVFPFIKFQDEDPILGPQMKSTGEVMGVGRCFAESYSKALHAVGRDDFKLGGVAFISVNSTDKANVFYVAKKLIARNFSLLATNGTAKVLNQHNIACEVVNKVREGRPHIVDMIKNGKVDFVINTTEGRASISDSKSIRSSAVSRNVSYTTTLAEAHAIVEAMGFWGVKTTYCLQSVNNVKEVDYEYEQ